MYMYLFGNIDVSLSYFYISGLYGWMDGILLDWIFVDLHIDTRIIC